MIHYHGTPVGGKRTEASGFLAGRHGLIPYPRPEDLGAALEVCRSIVLDNGAFSVWRKGGRLNVPGYIRWVESIYRHPVFTWALIPDVIDGSEADNDALLKEWPAKIPGVPVYHLHESLERAEMLVETYPTVALGSSGQWKSPGSASWWERIEQIMTVICDDQGETTMQTARPAHDESGDLPPHAAVERGLDERGTERVGAEVRAVPAADLGATQLRDREPDREPQFGGDLDSPRAAADPLRDAAIEYARAFRRHREWLAGRDTGRVTTTQEVQESWRPMYDAEMKLMKVAISILTE